jgi:hypothetical protein
MNMRKYPTTYLDTNYSTFYIAVLKLFEEISYNLERMTGLKDIIFERGSTSELLQG